MYYDRVFPAAAMCRWLGYGTAQLADTGARLLQRREFSFTTGDDVYIRYLSYENEAGLKKDLLAKLPHKIDIGAIFSCVPPPPPARTANTPPPDAAAAAAA